MNQVLKLLTKYIPDLALSDSHLFWTPKDALRGHRFADDELKHSVREELGRFGKEFYSTGIQHLAQR